jgi:hypothetical protein
MSDLQLTLTPEERKCLLALLDQTLKEKLVEEHRTKNLSYRESIVSEEKTLKSLLTKLREPVA